MISNLMILSILWISYIAFGCLALAMFSNFRSTSKKLLQPDKAGAYIGLVG